jgi:hypothetical protein
MHLIYMKSKIILVSVCLLNFVSYQPVFATQAKRHVVTTAAVYTACLPALKNRYQDDAVMTAFEEAQKDPSKFLDKLSGACGEHPAEWTPYCRNAIDSARKDDWLAARNQLSMALGLERDLPDWLLMKAVADQKTTAFDAAISDLEYLCKLRKERASGYKTIWEIKNQSNDNYWLSSRVLESYSKK